MGAAVIRRVAAALLPVAAAGALLAGPADAKRKAKAKAKAPVVTRVTPMTATLGSTLTISGRHFRTGARRNRVGFKAAGQPAIYLPADRATSRTIKITLTDALATVVGGEAKPFRLRVLTSRYGRRYTDGGKSPKIGPRTAPTEASASPPATTLPPAAGLPGGPVATCDSSADGAGDQDGDRLDDALEQRLRTKVCAADTDGDGVEDGYEYRSAIDLNDDEYQHPNQTLPAPVKRPYPNPLDGSDAERDYDGDLLDLGEEYQLWLGSTPPAERTFVASGSAATPLSFSDGLQYSVSVRCPAGDAALCRPQDAGRRVPALRADDDTTFARFFAWAQASGYDTVQLQTDPYVPWYEHSARQEFDIRDVNFNGVVTRRERNSLDFDGDGYLSDDERDGDVDGLTNYQELHGAMLPQYWTSCYAQEPPYYEAYGATDAADPDSDGDGVLDGADDQDFDDYPNLMELSRIRASGHDDTDGVVCQPRKALTEPDKVTGKLPSSHSDALGWIHPFNPCRPVPSRTCNDAYLDGYAGPIWWALQ